MITVMSIEDILIYHRKLSKVARDAKRERLNPDDAAYYQMKFYIDGSYDGHPEVKRAMQAGIDYNHLTIEELI